MEFLSALKDEWEREEGTTSESTQEGEKGGGPAVPAHPETGWCQRQSSASKRSASTYTQTHARECARASRRTVAVAVAAAAVAAAAATAALGAPKAQAQSTGKQMDLLRDQGVFLALLLLRATWCCCGEDMEPLLKAVGSSMEMGFCFGVDYIVGYKLLGEQRQLLGNSSSESPKGLSNRVIVTNHLDSLLGLEITNLTWADSGVYLRECWRDHQLMNQQKHYLYVCGEEAVTQEIAVAPDGGADFTCNTSSAELPGSSIRWYREVYPNFKSMLFLDTNQSLAPIQPELNGKIQVRDRGKNLHIPPGVMKESRNFYCLVLRAGQCLAFQNIELPEIEEPDVKTIFRSEGETVRLPCPMKHEEQTKRFWETPFGVVDTSTPAATTEEHHLRVQEGKTSNEYSLLISKLNDHHTGDYKCFAPLLVADYAVTVCPKHESKHVEVIEGGEVVLECMPLEGYFSIQWYRQNGSHEETLLVDSGDPSIALPEDLKGRAKVSEENYTLTISGLTRQDDRTYWCVVLEEMVFPEADYTEVDGDGSEEEDEGDDVIDGEVDQWADEDKCLSRRAIHLIYKTSVNPTAGSGKGGRLAPGQGSGPSPTTPSPEEDGNNNAAVFGIAGGVIGLIVVGAVIAVVFKMRAKNKQEPADGVTYSGSGGEVTKLDPNTNKP